ncbi:MAG: DUF2271 domain-containing protein [Bacteroides sp.]|nr:DUF2271 domain-containing protein [Bacteroides sp.]
MNSKLLSGRFFVQGLVLGLLLLTASAGGILAQEKTEGTMSFTVRTVTVNGNFSPRHVLAIWVEDESGFVLTRKLRAEKRKQYLYTWNGKSGGNVTDATTGATLSSHQTHTVTWDCKDKDGALVPDGAYKVYVEFTEAHVQGPLRMLAFTKGPEAVSLSPADETNFKDMALQFEPTVTVTAGFTFIAEELLVNFTSTSSGASSYDWDFGDGNTSQEENPSHTYASPGTYSVSLKATSGSTSDTKVQEITVSSTVGIGGANLDAQQVYPNPTSGVFTVNLDKDAGISSIKVFASNGSMVYAKEIEGKASHQVNMEAYESGTYILKVESKQASFSQKIVKE